jgi:alkanesulfonate monooxygenase SsuD/methylene tetrahydromethanopterin reductase-like flavin-dependent oxidoreductase (luciferase family)
VKFEPKPFTAPHPPLIIGGDGPAALRRAALYGGGWIPMNHSLDQLPASIARIAQLRGQAGIEGRVEITVGGSVDSAADLQQYQRAGVDRVIVRPWKSSREAVAGLYEFARNVVEWESAAG